MAKQIWVNSGSGNGFGPDRQVSFTHILQGYFTGTGAIIWLPQCQWSNPEEYGYINPVNVQEIISQWQNKAQENLVHILRDTVSVPQSPEELICN